ncbi:hypothetical protein P7C73_g6773, partial [Tremellales sp. Uapishka_1]
MRATRTRRPTRKIDYSYEEVGAEAGMSKAGTDEYPQDDEPTSKRSRRGGDEYEYGNGNGSSSRKVVIPGERRSARHAPVLDEDEQDRGTADNSSVQTSENTPVPEGEAGQPGKKGRKGMKGYAWVADAATGQANGASVNGEKAGGRGENGQDRKNGEKGENGHAEVDTVEKMDVDG